MYHRTTLASLLQKEDNTRRRTPKAFLSFCSSPLSLSSMSDRDPLLPSSDARQNGDVEAQTVVVVSDDELSYAHDSPLARALESRATHLFILTLVCIDIGIVVTDLAYTLLLNRCPKPGEPETGDPAWLNALSTMSTVITVAFLLEIPLETYAFGWKFYSPISQPLHFIDATVLIVTAVFELALSGPAKEVAGLVIIFRLWRIVRLAGGFTGVAVGVSKLSQGEISELERELEDTKRELVEAKQEIQQLRGRTGFQTSDEL
ncbi:hypothetical protein BKA62DRAFT_683665 [Auriculariales sp. MPI-PUGE-AT-0066]|nr:hypothetical protein BKA62DRAFT_683665 [Auriculariales sp. MPI-PUGE-AT-0066]